jgi:hypothetical protein
LVENWEESVIEITKHQNATPWFELRCGQLTGTTTKNVLRCVKFTLIDYENTEKAAKIIFELLGVPILRPSMDAINRKSLKDKKKCAKHWDTVI